MSPFEELCSRKCNTPVSWDNPIDITVNGRKLLREMEELMVKIRKNLKVSQDRKNRNVDKRRTHREFIVIEDMFLRIEKLVEIENFLEVGSKILWPF
jgi:hypothetical protein